MAGGDGEVVYEPVPAAEVEAGDLVEVHGRPRRVAAAVRRLAIDRVEVNGAVLHDARADEVRLVFDGGRLSPAYRPDDPVRVAVND